MTKSSNPRYDFAGEALATLKLDLKLMKESLGNEVSEPINKLFSLVDDRLEKLELSYDEVPSVAGQTGAYYLDLVAKNSLFLQREFLLSWETMFDELNVEPAFQEAAFKIFLLHEIVHEHQELNTPNHEGAGQHPEILSSIDYEADTFAVIVLFHLYKKSGMRLGSASIQEAEKYDLLFSDIIYAQLLAIAVFDFYSFLQPNSGSNSCLTYPFVSMGRGRLIRHLTWHLRYYLARSSSFSESWDGMELFFQPKLSITVNGQGMSMERIELEYLLDPLNEFELWALHTDTGFLSKITRFQTGVKGKWNSLFKGLYSADLEDSYQFFHQFFDENSQMIIGGRRSYDESVNEKAHSDEESRDKNITTKNYARLNYQGHVGDINIIKK